LNSPYEVVTTWDEAQQVAEPTCSSPGFAWLANVFMVGGWGWHPEVEMKAVLRSE